MSKRTRSKDALAITEFMKVMGAKGGAAKSPAKTAASRANGAKGGRPKKALKKPASNTE